MQFYLERLIDRLMVELMVFKIAVGENITAQLKGPRIARDIFRKHLLESLVLYKALPLEHSYIFLVCRVHETGKIPEYDTQTCGIVEQFDTLFCCCCYSTVWSLSYKIIQFSVSSRVCLSTNYFKSDLCCFRSEAASSH